MLILKPFPVNMLEILVDFKSIGVKDACDALVAGIDLMCVTFCANYC